MKLTKREEIVLKDIARYTRTPNESRTGYSAYWTPKTHEKLKQKGLVDYVSRSVFITNEGMEYLATKVIK